MATMKTSAETSQRTGPRRHSVVEQLTLLPTPSAPARFRLSQETRERGLRHVAEIRQMLAARADHGRLAELGHDRAA